MKTLVVCSGNICRSPMVAAYLRHRLAGAEMPHVVVDSAGTLGIEGAPASPEAIAVMAEIGVDLRGHRSRGVTAADLDTSELVLAMDAGHLATLAHRFPAGPGARRLLRAFEQGAEPAGDAPDLDDPVGAPVAVFRRQRDLIRVCVDHLITCLQRGGLPG